VSSSSFRRWRRRAAHCANGFANAGTGSDQSWFRRRRRQRGTGARVGDVKSKLPDSPAEVPGPCTGPRRPKVDHRCSRPGGGSGSQRSVSTATAFGHSRATRLARVWRCWPCPERSAHRFLHRLRYLDITACLRLLQQEYRTAEECRRTAYQMRRSARSDAVTVTSSPGVVGGHRRPRQPRRPQRICWRSTFPGVRGGVRPRQTRGSDGARHLAVKGCGTDRR
jgi:hypothetical protein